jgi:hypothetical protein
MTSTDTEPSITRGLIDLLLNTLDELAAVRTACDQATTQRDTAEKRIAEVMAWLSPHPDQPERGWAVSLNELGIAHLLGMLTEPNYRPWESDSSWQSGAVLGMRAYNDDPLPPPMPRAADPWQPLPEPDPIVTVQRGWRWWDR